MVKIAPSILSADFANLEREIRQIKTADYVHVDVMDGCFVPNISIGIPVVESIRRVTDLPLDVHLMIDRPSRYVEAFAKAGADLLTIHVEADIPEEISRTIAVMKNVGVQVGLSIKPKTPAEILLPWIEILDLVLVMTVEPGFGGQSFMEDQLPKIRTVRQMLREKNPLCELEVDGGIDLRTCRLAVEAGANVLVAGSAVYGAPDIPARIADLRRCASMQQD
ncbi:MAG: ribulose-phosphate 3-epimerase [Oscillospiraceae bacterium]|nr:ribulose-phosphate 3-epimerase [Oscillospiraceae bacterium]